MNNSQIDELKTIFGESEVLTDIEDMVAYSYDASRVEIQPEAVVFAKTTEQVSQLMKFAYREKICVTPRGTGQRFVRWVNSIEKGYCPCHGQNEERHRL